MKRVLAAAVVAVVASAAQSQAAVVTYPSLDHTFSIPANTSSTSSNGPVTLDAAAGVFQNTAGGGTNVADTRYYGGTFSYTPGSDDAGQAQWAGGVTITFRDSVNSSETLIIGKPGGEANWVIKGRAGGTVSSGIVASGDIPFVLKVEDLDGGWNIVHASIFYGVKATAGTEGTPDAMVELVSNNPLTYATLDFSSSDWAPKASGGSLAGFYSATTWTPVAVPEPTVLGLLGTAGLLLARRRK